MFESINIIAVLGTTLVMMAAGTVWYSPMLFGNAWMKAVGLTDEDVQNAKPHMLKNVLVTFIAYFTMLFLLAHLLERVSLLGIGMYDAALYLSIFVLAFFAAMTAWENRAWAYYVIHAGFYVAFIFAGSVIINLWPW